MSKTPLNNLLPFPVSPATSAGHPLPTELYFGRFTASECDSIRERFHEKDETAEKLGREFGTGTALIQMVVRVKRKPPANASANDRRQVKQVKAAA